MIENTYIDFSAEWKKNNINDKAHELVLLQEIFPWDSIINRLVAFYNEDAGPNGISLRTMVALHIIARLRDLSDRLVVKQVKENRYIQYFCNVMDENLATFVHPSSLCVFRKRLGVEGIAIIEEEIFNMFRDARIITGESALIDSSVLESNIIYPTDIRLIFKSFTKMAIIAKDNDIPLWWDEENVKKLWRECQLNKDKPRLEWLEIFFTIFASALQIFQKKVSGLNVTEKQKDKAEYWLALLTLLKEQTVQKIDGQCHIENRIVSLDDPDARPIIKGKQHPKCEFGTTEEYGFDRDGFLITVETFIGKPNDAKLYPDTIELFIERMKRRCPETVITDGGYRSRDNIKNKTPDGVKHLFMGRSSDVVEEQREFCVKARSATEGFIAVAKNLRGFGKSMYHGLTGHRIWSLLCQSAYNIKKFLQLYFEDKIEEKPLIKIGALSP